MSYVPHIACLSTKGGAISAPGFMVVRKLQRFHARKESHSALCFPCTMYMSVRNRHSSTLSLSLTKCARVWPAGQGRKRSPWCSALSGAKQAFVYAIHNAPSLALWTA